MERRDLYPTWSFYLNWRISWYPWDSVVNKTSMAQYNLANCHHCCLQIKFHLLSSGWPFYGVHWEIWKKFQVPSPKDRRFVKPKLLFLNRSYQVPLVKLSLWIIQFQKKINSILLSSWWSIMFILIHKYLVLLLHIVLVYISGWKKSATLKFQDVFQSFNFLQPHILF